jgi:predicted P-loop ATPase
MSGLRYFACDTPISDYRDHNTSFGISDNRRGRKVRYLDPSRTTNQTQMLVHESFSMLALTMVLENDERLRLLELLNEIKPYLVETDSVDVLARRLMESAESVDDFLTKIQSEHDRIKDSVLRTDLRIYMGRIRSRIKNRPP